MKRLLVTACVGLACSITAGAARPTAQATTDKKMKDGAVTATGCVAAGTSAGSYMLTDASLSGAAYKEGMADTAKMADKDKMAAPKDTMSSGHVMSYALVGGTDLKAHLGHKVEVMGMLDKSASMGKMDDPMAKDRMNKDKMDSKANMDHKSMKPATLTVQSVKMLSATCP